jgi:hypothetical protein
MGASKSMSKDKSMDASNSRVDNRRNTCNSMDASNTMDIDKGKSMDATNRRIKVLKNCTLNQGNSGAVVEYGVGNLRIGGSFRPVHRCFSSKPPENSGARKI